MSQSLTVEKLPQSEGFLHKYESAAVYQEQQEFLEDGKHVSLVGDSVEYLEVEPFDPNAESGGNSEHQGPHEEDWVD